MWESLSPRKILKSNLQIGKNLVDEPSPKKVKQTEWPIRSQARFWTSKNLAILPLKTKVWRFFRITFKFLKPLQKFWRKLEDVNNFTAFFPKLWENPEDCEKSLKVRYFGFRCGLPGLLSTRALLYFPQPFLVPENCDQALLNSISVSSTQVPNWEFSPVPSWGKYLPWPNMEVQQYWEGYSIFAEVLP